MCIAGSDTGFGRQVAEPCNAVSGTESRSPVFAPCTVVPDTRSPPLVGRWCTVLLARQSRSRIWSGLLSRPGNLFQSLPSKPCTFLPGSSFPQSVWQPCITLLGPCFQDGPVTVTSAAIYMLVRQTGLHCLRLQHSFALQSICRFEATAFLADAEGSETSNAKAENTSSFALIDSSWLCCEAELKRRSNGMKNRSSGRIWFFQATRCRV